TLDVLMPDLDGWTVLAALKEDPATRDIPVLLLTLSEDERRGFALGATDYLSKPIDWDRLGRLLVQYSPVPPGGGGGGGRSGGDNPPVLIVEDDPALRGLLREELTLAGWRVVEAGDGQEGLARFSQERPSVILLDLMMPVLDGFGFLEQLRA